MNKKKPVGVTMGWGMEPQLIFSDGKIYATKKIEKQLYPEYYPDDCEWPVNPNTGEKMEITN